MISEIGFLLLLLVMIISSLSFVEIIFAKTKLEIFKIDQRRLSNTIFPLTLVSFLCLIYPHLMLMQVDADADADADVDADADANKKVDADAHALANVNVNLGWRPSLGPTFL